MPRELKKELLDLIERTKFECTQVNGQRKLTNPFWTTPPPKGCEIFVVNLPTNCFEDEFFPIFETVGIIYETRLIMKFSDLNKGFAFITYTNRKDAQKAILLFNEFEIRPGHRISVVKSRDNDKLILKGLPMKISEVELYEELSKFTPGIIDVIKSSIHGFAFVEYDSHTSACQARKILIPNDVKLFDSKINVNWAEPPPDWEKQQLKSTTVLLVRNVPPDVCEGTLQNLFSPQGCHMVVKIKKFRNIAFIHYSDREDAAMALSALNGFNLNGNTIDVTWARPKLQRTNTTQTKSFNGLDSLLNQKQYFEPKLFGYCPVKTLFQVCQTNGWGEPIFYIILTSSTADELDNFYVAKVYIPNLPGPNKSFGISSYFLSSREAKNCIAEYALKNIPLQMCEFQKGPITYGGNTNYREYNMLPYQVADPVPKIDLSNSLSVWNPLSVNQNLPGNENLDQDSFLDLMATAASLASLSLRQEHN